MTPLHLAASSGLPAAVSVLLEKGNAYANGQDTVSFFFLCPFSRQSVCGPCLLS
jgi:hypothetical protein